MVKFYVFWRCTCPSREYFILQKFFQLPENITVWMVVFNFEPPDINIVFFLKLLFKAYLVTLAYSTEYTIYKLSEGLIFKDKRSMWCWIQQCVSGRGPEIRTWKVFDEAARLTKCSFCVPLYPCRSMFTPTLETDSICCSFTRGWKGHASTLRSTTS